MSPSSEPALPAKRQPRWRVVSLFVLSQIIVLSVIVEVGTRLFDPLGISYYPETARLLDDMIIEEPIGYRLPPRLEGRYYGVDVKINALGMRDRPVAPQKEPGEFRVLMIGDSVMFSIGVEYEDSIPYLIERLINEHAPPGRRYRTLNMGVPSYNTEQELIQLDQLGLSLQPDAAVMLLVANDIESKMWVYEKRSSLMANIAQRSYGTSLAYFLLRKWAKWLIPVAQPEPKEVELARAARSGDSKPIQRFEAIGTYLTKIGQKLRKVGVPFLLIYYRNVDDELVEIVRATGIREAFEVRGMDIWADPRWKDEDRSDYMNSTVDSHCNAKGCEVWAILIYESMVAAGLLD